MPRANAVVGDQAMSRGSEQTPPSVKPLRYTSALASASFAVSRWLCTPMASHRVTAACNPVLLSELGWWKGGGGGGGAAVEADEYWSSVHLSNASSKQGLGAGICIAQRSSDQSARF